MQGYKVTVRVSKLDEQSLSGYNIHASIATIFCIRIWAAHSRRFLRDFVQLLCFLLFGVNYASLT